MGNHIVLKDHTMMIASRLTVTMFTILTINDHDTNMQTEWWNAMQFQSTQSNASYTGCPKKVSAFDQQQNSFVYF